jgi:predicted nucleic acid-binding protein
LHAHCLFFIFIKNLYAYTSNKKITKPYIPGYDCFYLVLAQQQDATLLTKDKRLIRLAKKVDLAVVEC